MADSSPTTGDAPDRRDRRRARKRRQLRRVLGIVGIGLVVAAVALLAVASTITAVGGRARVGFGIGHGGVLAVSCAVGDQAPRGLPAGRAKRRC